MTTYKKAKLTITVDKKILEKAKEKAREKGVTLSKIIENYLKFFINPKVYCFKCGEKFTAEEADLCPKCGWMICPNCKACRCKLEEEAAIAVFHMRRTYEELLAGRVKK